LLVLGLSQRAHDDRGDHGQDLPGRGRIDARRLAGRGLDGGLLAAECVAENSGAGIGAPGLTQEPSDIVEDAAVMVAIEGTEQGGRTVAAATVLDETAHQGGNGTADYVSDVSLAEAEGLAQLLNAATLHLLHDCVEY